MPPTPTDPRPPCTDPGPGSERAAVDLMQSAVHLMDLVGAIQALSYDVYNDARTGPRGLVLVPLERLREMIAQVAQVETVVADLRKALEGWLESGEFPCALTRDTSPDPAGLV